MQRQAIEDAGSTVLDGFLRLHVEIFTVDIDSYFVLWCFFGQYFTLYQYVSLDQHIYAYILYVYIYICNIAMCNAMWYNEIIRRFRKDCQSSIFFAASCFYNLSEFICHFSQEWKKRIEKLEQQNSAYQARQWFCKNRRSLIAGPFGNLDALGEVEISSLERALQSGLERLGGPEVSAARRPPLGSQNLNFCVNCCHLGITWWKTLLCCTEACGM